MRRVSVICLMVMFAATAFAQPTIKAGGIVNSASYTPQSLSAGIAQGSIFNIFGSGLGPATLVPSSTYPLPTSLGGTSVSITSGTTTVAAIMIYTSAGQIAAVLPSSVQVGAASLKVTYNGQPGPAAGFQVVTSSFGAYTLDSSGTGAGIFTTPGYQLYGLSYAAQPGETVTMWGTGVGPVAGNEAAGPLPGNLSSVTAQVYVGGQQATVTYRGRSGCCAGLDQLAFVVPANVTGCHVPVAVQIGDTVSNFVTLPIASGTRICSDPVLSTGIDFGTLSSQSTISVGEVSLIRTTVTTTIPPLAPTTTTADLGGGIFAKYTNAQFNTSANPFNVNVNNFGACSVTTLTESTTTITPIPVLNFTELDAGPALTVNGPNGTKQLAKEVIGTQFFGYEGQLGGGISLPGSTVAPLYLDAGNYTVTGPGGADVGAFNVNLVVPAPLTWTNAASITTVNRAQGQLVTWTGGDPNGSIQIIGSSFLLDANTASDIIANFTCTVPASAQQFTIPAVVLLSLPASMAIDRITAPTGSLSLGSFPAPVSFSATGIDVGLAITGVETSQSVTYQ